MFVSYAQNGEDVVLWRALRHVEIGTYVDVGAADPTFFSVTRAFYDRGWSGLNVEPAPQYAELLEQERPRDVTVRCGAGDARGEAVFHVVPDTGLSTLDASLVPGIVEHHDVERTVTDIRTLDELLDEHGFGEREIHFLKIDVEGAEGQVLGGLDLERWRPWVVVVEATRQNSTDQNHDEWEKRLLDGGYRFCLFDGLNRFYVAAEHDELAPVLSYPAGIFDQPYRAASLDQVRAEHQQALDREHAHRLAEVQRLLDEERAARHEREVEHAAAAAVWDAQHRQLRADVEELRAAHEAAAEDARRSTADALRWRAEMMRLRQEVAGLDHVVATARHELALALERRAEAELALEAASATLDAVLATASWRITRPLRVARRIGRRRRASSGTEAVSATPPGTTDAAVAAPPAVAHEVGTAIPVPTAALHAFRARAGIVTDLLAPGATSAASSLTESLERLERAIEGSELASRTVAWLASLVVRGSYPDESDLDDAARLLRRSGARALVEHVEREFHEALRRGETRFSDLEVVTERVLVDVSHTAAHDLHTGIQRVVREVTARWLANPRTQLVQWNYSTRSFKALSAFEADRMIHWRRYVHAPGTEIQVRPLDEQTGKTIVPWRCRIVLPELVANPPAATGLRALAQAGIVERFSMIGYDFVPVMATETVTDGMTANFGHYLSVVKHATHLSAISASAAREFRAFNEMLASQGLSGPQVYADPLPTQVPVLGPSDVARARDEFDIGSLPLVLVVGSHEPRKNHLVVLEAAEALWREGHRFDLLFAGGSTWGGSRFASYVAALEGAGFPVRVYERIGETSLWGLYQLSRCSVFPSLLEGYGLPVAESLASGTPVITSNFGSMAEIAIGGGAIVVDPRDPTEVASALRRLLVDDAEHERLAAEALARRWPTWDEYADEVWHELVG